MKDEHKEKISLALRGKPKSPEHREKIRQGNLGKSRGKFSADHIEKIRLGNIGKVISEETRDKMRLAKEKVYKIISPTGKKYFIKSCDLSKFCLVFKLNKGSLLNACRFKKLYKRWEIIVLGMSKDIFKV